MNYFMSAKKQVTIQGISVNLSAEFEKGKLPAVINITASGAIIKEDKTSGQMHLNANYNTKTGNFDSCNGVNVPVSFLQEVVTEAIDMFNQIETEFDEVNS